MSYCECSKLQRPWLLRSERKLYANSGFTNFLDSLDFSRAVVANFAKIFIIQSLISFAVYFFPFRERSTSLNKSMYSKLCIKISLRGGFVPWLKSPQHVRQHFFHLNSSITETESLDTKLVLIVVHSLHKAMLRKFNNWIGLQTKHKRRLVRKWWQNLFNVSFTYETFKFIHFYFHTNFQEGLKCDDVIFLSSRWFNTREEIFRNVHTCLIKS